MRTIVITDMDGTLLDPSTYSFDPAEKALRLLKEKEVPLVLCTSKTRAEIEFYRRRLGNTDPFISENGGGVFVPEGYFPFGFDSDTEDGYRVLTLGTPYETLREALKRVSERTGIRVTGFGDLTAKDVAVMADLPLEEARMAVQRDFDEPFVFGEGETGTKPFLEEIEKEGLRWTLGGRYYHILGDNDKGRAVRVLTDLYRKAWGEVRTIGLGDSLNDLPLLKEVDTPVVVRKKDGTYDPKVELPGVVKADGIGPAGWNEAVTRLVEE